MLKYIIILSLVAVMLPAVPVHATVSATSSATTLTVSADRAFGLYWSWFSIDAYSNSTVSIHSSAPSWNVAYDNATPFSLTLYSNASGADYVYFVIIPLVDGIPHLSSSATVSPTITGSFTVEVAEGSSATANLTVTPFAPITVATPYMPYIQPSSLNKSTEYVTIQGQYGNSPSSVFTNNTLYSVFQPEAPGIYGSSLGIGEYRALPTPSTQVIMDPYAQNLSFAVANISLVPDGIYLNYTFVSSFASYHSYIQAGPNPAVITARSDFFNFSSSSWSRVLEKNFTVPQAPFQVYDLLAPYNDYFAWSNMTVAVQSYYNILYLQSLYFLAFVKYVGISVYSPSTGLLTFAGNISNVYGEIGIPGDTNQIVPGPSSNFYLNTQNVLELSSSGIRVVGNATVDPPYIAYYNTTSVSVYYIPSMEQVFSTSFAAVVSLFTPGTGGFVEGFTYSHGNLIAIGSIVNEYGNMNYGELVDVNSTSYSFNNYTVGLGSVYLFPGQYGASAEYFSGSNISYFLYPEFHNSSIIDTIGTMPGGGSPGDYIYNSSAPYAMSLDAFGNVTVMQGVWYRVTPTQVSGYKTYFSSNAPHNFSWIYPVSPVTYVNVTYVPVLRGYNISFVSNVSLPYGVRVSNSSFNSTYYSSGRYDNVSLPAGLYRFEVLPPQGYRSNVTGGELDVTGNASVHLGFLRESFTVRAVVENFTGEWYFTMGNLTYSSNSTSLAFTIPSGRYQYSFVFPPIYSATNSSGIINVYSNTTITSYVSQTEFYLRIHILNFTGTYNISVSGRESFGGSYDSAYYNNTLPFGSYSISLSYRGVTSWFNITSYGPPVYINTTLSGMVLYTVRGIVYAGTSPELYVNVTLVADGRTYTGITSQNGTFQFSVMAPPGSTFSVYVNIPGYQPFSYTGRLSSANFVTVTLVPSPERPAFPVLYFAVIAVAVAVSAVVSLLLVKRRSGRQKREN